MSKQRRLGIIGAGQIARAVACEVAGGRAGSWQLCGVLGRRAGSRPGFPIAVCADMDAFASTRPDLILELAGPEGLKQHGAWALAITDTWSISAGALHEQPLYDELERAGRKSGHRLRLVAGAIGALEAMSAVAQDPDAEVEINATTVAGRNGEPFFTGSAREAVKLFEGINVVATAAIAGPGLDRTTVRYDEFDGSGRFFTIEARSKYGRFSFSCTPMVTEEHGSRTVSAQVVAALKQCDQIIWAG